MRLLIFFFLFYISYTTTAQDFKVRDLDTTVFPDISFTLAGSKPIEKNQVIITDANKPVKEFQWVSSKNAEARSIFFLIEASSFVSNAQLAFVKRAVKTELLSFSKSDLANAGFYVRSNSVEMLKRLSTEFTADFNSLSRDVESKIYISNDKSPATDLYKVVYECLDFISKKNNLPGNKKIILISTGNNNGTSAFTINECVAKAKESNIVITAIGLRSAIQNAMDNLKLLAEKTNGSFTFAKNEADINLLLQQENETDNSVSYLVKYRSNATLANDTVAIQVTINGQVQELNYVSGKNITTGFISNNRVVLIIAGAGMLLLIAGLVFYLSNKRKKRKKEETFRLQQQELMQRELLRKKAEKEAEEKKMQVHTGTSASSTQAGINKPVAGEHIHRTSIAGVKRPQLTVMQPGAQKFYELNNLSARIGRNADNDIVIADKTVSGSHAVISNEQGKVFITDKNSTNGTFVNNAQVQRAELHNNDLITLGKIDIRYNY